MARDASITQRRYRSSARRKNPPSPGCDAMGMAMGGGGRRGGSRFTDINVTPLVDVMLVLLVVFMVTAPLLTTGLRVELPKVNAVNTPVRDSKLVVTVTPNERIEFDGKDVTNDIEHVLDTNPRVQKEHELYIRAD